MYDVCCTGIIVADVIAKTVDRLPVSGRLDLLDKLELHIGGCAANAAIDMSIIGLKTAIIGKIGEDGFGAFARGELERNHVECRGLKTSSKHGTSASVVTVNSSGERSFLHHIGANAALCGSDVDYEIVKNSKVLFIAGALLMPGFDGEDSAELLARAQTDKVYTALDTAWDASGRWMIVLKPCLKHLDLFIPSQEEAEMLSGEKEPEKIADVFIREGVKLAVIKLGAKGCFIKSRTGEKLFVGAYERVKAVDTTGAGDSFVSGFLTGIVKGWDLRKCGEFANAVGAHCVMQTGATAGIKSMAEIQKFIEDYKV